jgi:hypothetical protein
MQATYSNYDSDAFISGSKNKLGGLNPNQEFRPQPQKVENGAGLLVSVLTDVKGKVSIDFTNLIEEPYAFVDEYSIDPAVSPSEINPEYAFKTFLVSVKAKNFRIRFRNLTTQKQQKLKLFTFILPSSPVVSINPDTLENVVLNTLTKIFDSSGNKIYSVSNALYVSLRDGYGNIINSLTPSTDTNNALITHNICDYSNNELTMTINNPNITSTSLELKKYKNFDIILTLSSSTNLLPIRLYIYISDNNSNYFKTDKYIDIYYGDTNISITNITINSKYIKLQGTSPYASSTYLTISSCYILEKN